jgi:hypothetical protein
LSLIQSIIIFFFKIIYLFQTITANFSQPQKNKEKAFHIRQISNQVSNQQKQPFGERIASRKQKIDNWSDLSCSKSWHNHFLLLDLFN